MKGFHITSSLVLLGILTLGFSQTPQGEQIFQQNCAVCHGPSGEGAVGPALADNANLADTTRVVDQILYGGQAMPPFAGTLSDEQIAAVATFIRTAWNNDFGEVSTEQVAARRSGEPIEDQQAGQAQNQAATQPAQTEGGETEQAQPEASTAAQVFIQVDANADPARLVDGEGRTLYRFVYDAPTGVPHCYEPCTNRWVPVLVTEQARAGEGVGGDLLGTVEREDGVLQATYKGWPLYWLKDEEPGTATGDEISDVWTSVQPDIEALEGVSEGTQQ